MCLSDPPKVTDSKKDTSLLSYEIYYDTHPSLARSAKTKLKQFANHKHASLFWSRDEGHYNNTYIDLAYNDFN